MRKDTKTTAAVAANWQLITPRFPTGTRDGYFARLRAERDLWGGNPILVEDENGKMTYTHYPLGWEDWCNSFGCYLEKCGLTPSDDFNRSHVFPEPDLPLAYVHWIEYLSHPARARHWKKWNALYMALSEGAESL
ncbi:hypothetical protein EON83_25585 [bacterium]|nr:MAG: hypothetical protein EON83_25585 [bacterium]